MKEISINEYIYKNNKTINSASFEFDKNTKIFYTQFKNIFVNPKLWSVITEDFYIFSDFERYLSPFKHNKEIILREKEIIKISQSIQQIKGKFFLFGGEGNYWHFMIDFMPRLYCLKYLPFSEIKIIIPDSLPQKFFQFILKICNLLEINNIKFLRINRENLIYYFENLIFSSRPTISFTSIYFHKLLENSINKSKIKNLYIKRGNTNNRKVLNENELIKILKNYNYNILDCAELSIEQQIKGFSEAKNIIIPSGAAMANLLFVPDDINVVEIRSNLDGDFSKNINLKNRFKLYHFEKTTKVGPKLRKDIIVDIQELVKLVEEKIIY